MNINTKVNKILEEYMLPPLPKAVTREDMEYQSIIYPSLLASYNGLSPEAVFRRYRLMKYFNCGSDLARWTYDAIIAVSTHIVEIAENVMHDKMYSEIDTIALRAAEGVLARRDRAAERQVGIGGNNSNRGVTEFYIQMQGVLNNGGVTPQNLLAMVFHSAAGSSSNGESRGNAILAEDLNIDSSLDSKLRDFDRAVRDPAQVTTLIEKPETSKYEHSNEDNSINIHREERDSIIWEEIEL